MFNQFEETYSIRDLASKVQRAALTLGVKADVAPVENPRAAAERQDHYFAPDHDRLRELGYQPTHDIDAEVRSMLEDLLPYRDRIAKHAEGAPARRALGWYPPWSGLSCRRGRG